MQLTRSGHLQTVGHVLWGNEHRNLAFDVEHRNGGVAVEPACLRSPLSVHLQPTNPRVLGEQRKLALRVELVIGHYPALSAPTS